MRRLAPYLFFCLAFLPPAAYAQTSLIPLPETSTLRETLRSRALEAGAVPAGPSTQRMRNLLYYRKAGDRDAWLEDLEELWQIPEGVTPLQVRVEAAVEYAPHIMENGYRELRVTEEMPICTIRGAGAGKEWEFLMEVEWREKWALNGRDWWNLPRRFRQSDRRMIKRASLGVKVGPFLLELGRLGRNWSTGRSGGLMLGGEVRFFDGVAVEAGDDTWAFELLYSPLEPGLTEEERQVIAMLGRLAFDQHEKSVFMHRLTWRPRPNFRLGVTEGAVFYGHRPTIADLGPVLIQHDRYQDFDNLMIGFDVLWYPRPGLGLYAEIAVDDLRAPMEPENSDPSAFGFLCGAEALQGPWEAFLEVVTTSERMYHYPHPLGRWESRLRHGTLMESWIPDYDQPLGHWIGPDAAGIFTGIWRILPVETGRGTGSARGIAPIPPPRAGLIFSRRENRSLRTPPDSFPQPVDLTDPEERPLSRVVITTVSLTLDWPFRNFGWLETAVTSIQMEGRPIVAGSYPAYSDRGIEFRLGFRLLLL